MHLLGGVIEDAAEFTHRTGRLLGSDPYLVMVSTPRASRKDGT
jgi:hypothetical protein